MSICIISMYIFTQWLCIYNRLRLSVIGFIHFFFLISQTPTSPVFRPMASLIIQGKQDQCCSLLCPENSMITIFQQVLVQMHGHHHPLNKWSSALFSPENTASGPLSPRMASSYVGKGSCRIVDLLPPRDGFKITFHSQKYS